MPHEFAQALVDKVGGLENLGGEPAPQEHFAEGPAVEVLEETPEPEAEEDPGVTMDSQGRLRGPDGKFVAKEEEPEAPAEEPAAEEQPAEEQGFEDIVLEIDDPDVAAFLEKYDGDLNKALRGATELQRLQGRQGQELGELREMKGQLEALQQIVAQQQQPRFAGPDPRVLIEDDPKAAAHLAVQQGDANTMMAAVQAWAEEEPFEAALFVTNLQQEYAISQLREELQGQQPAPADPELELAKAMAPVLQRHPDLEQHLPDIGEAAKERPLLRRALEEGSPQERAQALEDLYVIARSRQTGDTSAEAIRRIQVRSKAEAEQAKAEAAVVSASRGSAASAGQPTGADLFRTAFREYTGLPLEDE